MAAKAAPKRRPRTPTRVPDRHALVFISHDTRDRALAEAFEDLLRDASGGVLKMFRSSDRRGASGIEFGAEWYTTIMTRLAEATDVVAILTRNSLSRPWILYEVGVARGRLEVPAFGVAFGMRLETVQGPFAQFQNSEDDEDSLTKLVMQLIRRNPEADPREEAVRLQVQVFRSRFKAIPGSTREAGDDGGEPSTVGKLFEEIKIMFRELSDQIATRSAGALTMPSRVLTRTAQRIIDEMKFAELRERATLWEEFTSVISTRVKAPIHGIQDVLQGLRQKDSTRLHEGVARFTQFLETEGRSTATDEIDMETYALLDDVAQVLHHWERSGSPVRRRTSPKP